MLHKKKNMLLNISSIDQHIQRRKIRLLKPLLKIAKKEITENKHLLFMLRGALVKTATTIASIWLTIIKHHYSLLARLTQTILYLNCC